ncbi:hypothetical protein BUALT_Bualt16G0006200 [Buddleja alternifolia]|uniref:Phytocyanin domain-containing protein n=1 Tax=Buddleja alternifolia TaxID=168488 RepID=A0AAV6WEJ2_9LAMI|nr:hypothetical protein BUALT_Bualt16G0006200 [Buddleja alternifolia]
MASKTRFVLAMITLLCFLQLLECVYCSEFEVGERGGWAVHPKNDTKWYNEWASHKRFKVGDTIRFKYKKDSVMEVDHKDYEECSSTRPNYFSNTGNTVYTLDRSGFFYFISGATGHCDKGQKMIVWVIGQEVSGGASYASDNNPIFSFGLSLIIFAFQFVYLHH